MPKSTKRPECPVCSDYCDRERDNKGRFYTACYKCGYDSRTSEHAPRHKRTSNTSLTGRAGGT